MTPSPPTTRDVSNTWASFYVEYRGLVGAANGPRGVEVARKEWLAILNNLRGGNLRQWPTEPNEIRQIQELLHWEQRDMWSVIYGMDPYAGVGEENRHAVRGESIPEPSSLFSAQSIGRFVLATLAASGSTTTPQPAPKVPSHVQYHQQRQEHQQHQQRGPFLGFDNLEGLSPRANPHANTNASKKHLTSWQPQNRKMTSSAVQKSSAAAQSLRRTSEAPSPPAPAPTPHSPTPLLLHFLLLLPGS